MPINRHTPLKQNIRVWYDYLKTAIRHKYKINKDYYSAWHLPQVKKLTFDKWWISHKHLFAQKDFINVRVLNELSLNDAMKEVKKQLIGKVDQKTNFHITTERFRYTEVDDYLKCWIRRKEKKHTYDKIGRDLIKFYENKKHTYSKSQKLIRRKFTSVKPKNNEVLLQLVRRKVLNAEKIILNTAKGQFTGKY